jgi:hypothetical protein
VRRDEAKAADEEKRSKERAALAEQEHRTKILRDRAADRNDRLFGVSSSSTAPVDGAQEVVDGNQQLPQQHVNFFAELESEERKNLGTANKDYQLEKKTEKDAIESKLGIMKYLGEGSSEYTKTVPWYQQAAGTIRPAPAVVSSGADKVINTSGLLQKRALPTGVLPPTIAGKRKRKKEHKHRHHKSRRHRSSSSSSSSSDHQSTLSSSSPVILQPKSSIEQLRAERLQREREERSRADALIRKSRGEPELHPNGGQQQRAPVIKQKYNSRFNPDIARQNAVDYSKK